MTRKDSNRTVADYFSSKSSAATLKIERLEAEKRQLEDRIRQLKHAAQTAERKRLTRTKIILGSLMLRNHAELLPKLVDEASPQDRELLHSVFPNAARKESPSAASSQ